ncbi:MAG: endonuclease/exonuclease/phosphatase family protein, partial [Coleofasciculaceae cyanobacterium]
GTIVLEYPSNGIQNGSPDGIALVDNNNSVIQFLSYEGSFTAASGSAAGLTSTDIDVAEGSSTPVGFSLQLNGDGSEADDFSWSAEGQNTFGAFNTGQTFNGSGGNGGGNGNGDGEPDLTPIYQIQGAAQTSPLEGQTVTTRGIVTAVDSNGFYLQDAQGDGDIATSDGIFVFTSSRPSVSVGDEVEAEGSVSEFIPGGASTGNLSTTQLFRPDVTVLSSGNPLPDAVILGQGGRVPPNQIIDNDTPPENYNVLNGEGNYEPTEDGIDFYESLEGMWVTVQDALAVSGTNRFGEIFTVADNGANATGLSDRGTINISPDDYNPERIQIQFDSGILSGFEQSVDVGAQLGDVTGVVGYNFGNFEVNVTEPFTPVSSSDLEPEVSTIIGDDTRLTLASYNVLNLEPNDSDGDTDVADSRFEAIASDIVNNLNLPDIIGLQEIQDSDGSVNSDITAANETLELLVNEIREISGISYEFIDNPFIGDDTNGGQPGGNIRTVFLYNPGRVDFVEGSLSAVTDPQDQQTNPDNPFFNSRLPLAGSFRFNGEEITVVNNHFSSKGGSTPLIGQIQPAADLQEDPQVNGSLDERRDQAEAVQNFVANILNSNPDANVAVLGDFNEFEFISPLEILEQSLTNLTETLPEDERYSFIFQGNSQSLDHILVSDSLDDMAEFDIVHVNTEFAETSQTASDHDPLLSSFFVLPEDAILGTANRDALNGTNTDDVIFGLAGDDNINGNGGNDTFKGGAGNDRINGNAGNDFIDGGAGNDRINGNGGDDIIVGGAGDDFITTGSGNDTIISGSGNDIIQLNGGMDLIYLDLGTGFDTIGNFQLGSTKLVAADPNNLTFENSQNGVNIFQENDLLAFVGNTQASTLSNNIDTVFA